MSNPSTHGFFPGQGNPQHFPSPFSGPGAGAVDGPGPSPGSSAKTQGWKNKRPKDMITSGLHGHPADLASGSRPKPKKRPDPSASPVTAPCSECGKRFWSQKALFGHMRCHPERHWRGINPPPHLRRPQAPCESPQPPTPRCPRPPPPSQQRLHHVEREVASYLVMLANGPAPAGAPAGLVADPGAMGGIFGCASPKTSFASTHKNTAASLGLERNERREQERGTGCTIKDDNYAAGVGGNVGRRAAEGIVMMGSDHRRDVCREDSSRDHEVVEKRRRTQWERGDGGAASSPSRRGHVPDLNLPPPLENSDSSA